MKNSPLVSVIINCHNSSKYIKESIESVFSQTYSNWEIIALNNASTDKTKELILSFESEKIKYFENNEKVTLGKARNQAINFSKGDYIAILDSDDIWLPEKLDEQIRIMLRNSNIGFSFSNSNIFNEEKILFPIFKKSKPKEGQIFGSLLETVQSYISSETIIYDKKKLIKSKIKYNERFSMAVDYDVILRLALIYKVKYVNKVLSKCRLHSKSESQKLGDLVPKENFSMIQEILKNNPSIENDYPMELKKFYYINTYLMSFFKRKVFGIKNTFKYLFFIKHNLDVLKLIKIFFLTEIKYYFYFLKKKY